MHLLFWEKGIEFEDYYAKPERVKAVYRASFRREMADRRKRASKAMK